MGAKTVAGRFLAVSLVLAAPRWVKAQEPNTPGAPKATPSKPKTAQEASAQAVARLVEQLRRHPVRPKAAPDRHALYMIDLTNGKVTLIADQPGPNLTHCGSSTWSHDGRRILFDATPGTQWALTHLKAIEVGEGRPSVTDLGTGNCPSFSPADDRIAFLSNADGVQMGVWMMKADGSGRRLLGDYGRPAWSPDGRQLMIISFSNPRQVTLMDADPDRSGVLRLADYQIHADPSWAGEGTIVAVIGPTEADTLALIDVSDPSRPRVKDVLWRRANGPDVEPSYPIYSATSRRCIFVGTGAKGGALYSVDQGKSGPAKRVEPEGYDRSITSLAFSPDSRYLLFSCDGPDRRVSGAAAGGREAAKGDKPTLGVSGRERKGEIFVTGQTKTGRGVSLIAIDPENREHRVVVEDCSSRARVSRDGRRVAYEKDDALWVQGLEPGAEPRCVVGLADANSGSPAAWSPDGNQLIISPGHHDNERRVWVHKTLRVNIDGSDREELPIPTEDNVQDWSPDGRWLLTASSRNAKIGWQLYIMRPDGTEQRRITEGGNPFYARFSPDGRRVLYTDNARGDQSGIWVVDADGTNARRLFPVDRNTIGTACWSPDGKRIAVTLSPLNPNPQAGRDPEPVPVVVVDLDGGGQSKIVVPGLGRTDMPDWR
jgi:Tol biopolymer transport system component